MMDVRLGPASYVVLGMLALRGPSTSYELKRAIGHSVGHFWSFPHALLYTEPARLAAAGLLSEDREAGGRRRRVYRITEAGYAALRAWLGAPTEELYQMRDVALLKLFYSELVPPERVVALAEGQVGVHRERVAAYEGLQARFGDRPELANRMAPLQMGLALERAFVAFWTSIAAQPPSAGPR
jgi:DNA-binding PadR family transcriptional regulator